MEDYDRNEEKLKEVWEFLLQTATKEQVDRLLLEASPYRELPGMRWLHSKLLEHRRYHVSYDNILVNGE